MIYICIEDVEPIENVRASKCEYINSSFIQRKVLQEEDANIFQQRQICRLFECGRKKLKRRHAKEAFSPKSSSIISELIEITRD